MRKEHQIIIDPVKCNRCGMCRDDCPDKVLVVTDKSAEHTGQYCVKCGHCVAICPQGAVIISGYDDEPEAITGGGKVDPDALLRLVKSRRSMRQFTGKDIPPQVVSQIIEAGRYTPTGGNRQDVSYIVIREKKDEYEEKAIEFLRRAQPELAVTNP
jgi:ferredoxin